MTIFVKNKHTLQIDEFKFRCCIGKKGATKSKREGDKKTPKGVFKIENLYFRNDRKEKPSTSLKCIEIKENIEEVHEWVKTVLDSKELIIERTRKGKKVVDDIRPYIRDIEVQESALLKRPTIQAELRTQPRSLRPSELLAAVKPNLTMVKLRRLKQFIDTGDNQIDPIDLGDCLNFDMELCSP